VDAKSVIVSANESVSPEMMLEKLQKVNKYILLLCLRLSIFSNESTIGLLKIWIPCNVLSCFFLSYSLIQQHDWKNSKHSGEQLLGKV
jgi:hypothetical protein